MNDKTGSNNPRALNGAQLARMHTFESAARHQSFTLAAGEMSLSPSAISHQIAQLEEELGIQLFTRSHRKVELTAEGRRVYWTMQASLQALNSEILDIKNQALSGTLTVYCRPSLAQCWLVPRLGDFITRHPAISLTLLTGNEWINFQQAGIDLAIYFDDLPADGPPRHFLMDESILPVCSLEYARKLALRGEPDELQRCTLLHDRQAWNTDSGGGEWQSWATHAGVTLPTVPGVGFDRSDLAVTAAMSGMGLAIGRARLVRQYLDDGQLIAPFGERALPCRQQYYIATPPGRQWPKITAFTDWLKSTV